MLNFITAPKGNCERPEIPNGTFVQIDGKNVTDNQIYDICTEIIYKCENPDHRLIYNSNTTENSRRFCDASTQNWTGSPPKCGKSYFYSKMNFSAIKNCFPTFWSFLHSGNMRIFALAFSVQCHLRQNGISRGTLSKWDESNYILP